jgi:hypothetical protein
VVLPETLFDIDPEDTDTPLVPPLVWLTVMPLELVVVPSVVIFALALVSVEQLPLQAALARLLEYPVLSDTLAFATLLAPPPPTAATGTAVIAVASRAAAATHANIDRFIVASLSSAPRISGGASFCPTGGPLEHDNFAPPCFRTEHSRQLT